MYIQRKSGYGKAASQPVRFQLQAGPRHALCWPERLRIRPWAGTLQSLPEPVRKLARVRRV